MAERLVPGRARVRRSRCPWRSLLEAKVKDRQVGGTVLVRAAVVHPDNAAHAHMRSSAGPPGGETAIATALVVGTFSTLMAVARGL
jgi:hypothetical protein